MNTPEWRRIADDIAVKIQEGVYPPGTRLPALPQLCADYQVSVKTIQTALIVLQYRDMVQPRHGVGFFVIGPADPPVSPAPRSPGPTGTA